MKYATLHGPYKRHLIIVWYKSAFSFNGTLVETNLLISSKVCFFCLGLKSARYTNVANRVFDTHMSKKFQLLSLAITSSLYHLTSPRSSCQKLTLQCSAYLMQFSLKGIQQLFHHNLDCKKME